VNIQSNSGAKLVRGYILLVSQHFADGQPENVLETIQKPEIPGSTFRFSEEAMV